MITALFLTLLVLVFAVRLTLSVRQIRHVFEHRDAVPSPMAGQISPEAHRRAASYAIARERQNLVLHALDMGVKLLLTLLGGLMLVDTLVAQFGLADFSHQIVFLATLGLIGFLLSAGLEAWREFGIERRFGFSRMTARLFVADQLRALALTAVIGIGLAAAAVAFMRGAGALWWLWAWIGWLAFLVLAIGLGPSVIAPLFNRFSPLPEGELKQRLSELAKRAGFELEGVFVVDGSRRSSHANAYLAGLGRKRRIVLYDTLMAKLKAEEIEAVLAHELGHAHHKHIPQRLFLMAAVSLPVFAFLGWAHGSAAFHQQLGVTPSLERGYEGLTLALFWIVLPLLLAPLAPLMALWSRKHEYEADAYATRLSSQPAALRDALLTLYRDNASTLTPDPWYSRAYHSHPPALHRLNRLPLDSVASPAGNASETPAAHPA